jgi:hypothetical protein
MGKQATITTTIEKQTTFRNTVKKKLKIATTPAIE